MMTRDEWDNLSSEEKFFLWRVDDPRVPYDYKIEQEKILNNKGTVRKQRVVRPEGFVSTLTVQERYPERPPSARQILASLTWEQMTQQQHHYCWIRRDKRVPEGWLPPNFSTRDANNKLKWEFCSARGKRTLWRQKDPRVPEGWNPDDK